MPWVRGERANLLSPDRGSSDQKWSRFPGEGPTTLLPLNTPRSAVLEPTQFRPISSHRGRLPLYQPEAEALMLARGPSAAVHLRLGQRWKGTQLKLMAGPDRSRAYRGLGDRITLTSCRLLQASACESGKAWAEN